MKKARGNGKVSGRLDQAARAMELPPGLFGKTAQITLISNREAIIDGCRGILEYSDAVVRVNTGETVVRFTGRSLSIKSLSDDQAVIEGFILSMDFSS